MRDKAMILLEDYLKEKNMTVYECSKKSKIPYSTLSDLAKGKKQIEKCSCDTVYKLAKALDTTVEFLIEELHIPKRPDFELFKSNVCHDIKRKGDLNFIIDIISSHTIQDYWSIKWYLEAMYLIGILDYLCRVNNIPKCSDYDLYRGYKMDNLIVPRSVLYTEMFVRGTEYREKCIRNSIPELLNFNIVEGDIRNVV